MNGFVYMANAWLGGRFGQRFGSLNALGIGVGIMTAALLCGAFVNSQWGHVAVMATCTLGMCFTWPNLEALVSEKSFRRDSRTRSEFTTWFGPAWAAWPIYRAPCWNPWGS